MRFLRHLPRRLNATTSYELRIPQPLPSNTAKRLNKSTTIILFAFVESERLFIQIPEQMKRLYTHIRSFDATLEQTPEVFQPVSVNMAFRIALGMVNNLVNKLVIEFRVRAKRIRDYFGTFFHVFVHSGIKLRAAYVSPLIAIAFVGVFFLVGFVFSVVGYAFYFCLHRGSLSENTASWQARSSLAIAGFCSCSVWSQKEYLIT